MLQTQKSLKAIIIFLVITLLSSCVSVSEYINSDDVLSWEPDIALFDSLNRVEFADANTLLVTGSSSIRLWDSIHTDLEPYVVMQRGYGGAKLNDFCHYADRIIRPQTFKAILIFIANDIEGGENDRTPREVLKLFKVLVGKIRERNPDTPVFWIEVTPTPSRWAAYDRIKKSEDLISRYCNRNDDLHFIATADIFFNEDGLPDPKYFRKDMLHLNREGYRVWAARIKEVLQQEGINK